MSDYSQTAASVIPGPNPRRRPVILAETVSAGMPGYITTAGTAGKADGNDAAKCAAIGYFEQGGSAGQKVNLITEDDAANLGITFAIGDIPILSTAAGAYAPAADAASGTFVTVFGVATSTTTMKFRPVSAGAAKV